MLNSKDASDMCFGNVHMYALGATAAAVLSRCMGCNPGVSIIRCQLCRYIRHPGYLGFLLWCVGTQMLLVNPVCCIIFTIVVRSTSQESCYLSEVLLISLALNLLVISFTCLV